MTGAAAAARKQGLAPARPTEHAATNCHQRLHNCDLGAAAGCRSAAESGDSAWRRLALLGQRQAAADLIASTQVILRRAADCARRPRRRPPLKRWPAASSKLFALLFLLAIASIGRRPSPAALNELLAKMFSTTRSAHLDSAANCDTANEQPDNGNRFVLLASAEGKCQ
jgi:hypothetical protein